MVMVWPPFPLQEQKHQGVAYPKYDFVIRLSPNPHVNIAKDWENIPLLGMTHGTKLLKETTMINNFSGTHWDFVNACLKITSRL